MEPPVATYARGGFDHVNSERSRKPERVSPSLFVLLAAIKLAVHLPILDRYDYHGDELYFIECGLHLDWGYVDHPPLVVWLVRLVGEVIGYSLPVLRAFPLLAGSLLIYLTMRMTARLGGSWPAQAIAGAAVLLAPAYLRMATLVNIPAFEQVLWALATLCFLDLLQNENRAQLWRIGIVVGIGLLLKSTFLLFAAAYTVAIVIYRRDCLFDGRLWLGGLLALLLWSPNLVWQMNHEWAHLQFLRNISQPEGMIGREPRILFLAGQLLYFNPAAVAVWISGLYALGRDTTLRAATSLYVVPLALLLLTNGKPYYLAPAYPLLFAAGGVFWQSRLTTALGWVSLLGPMTTIGGIFAFLSLPYLPLAKMDRVLDSLLMGVVPAIGLTHDYHNQLSWQRYYPTMREIYAALPIDDRSATIIIAGFYRQASGMRLAASRDRHDIDPAGGEPGIYSPHLTYHFWPPDFANVKRALVLSIPQEILALHFNEIKKVGEIDHPTRPEASPDVVYLVESPKRPWPEVWRALKWFHNSPYRIIAPSDSRMRAPSGSRHRASPASTADDLALPFHNTHVDSPDGRGVSSALVILTGGEVEVSNRSRAQFRALQLAGFLRRTRSTCVG